VFFAYVYPSNLDLIPQPLWNRLADALDERVRHPKKGESFRGTLIDPNMFAIDVKEWGERDLFREYCERHPAMIEVEEPKYGKGTRS
jgi:hypothetical protein